MLENTKNNFENCFTVAFVIVQIKPEQNLLGVVSKWKVCLLTPCEAKWDRLQFDVDYNYLSHRLRTALRPNTVTETSWSDWW